MENIVLVLFCAALLFCIFFNYSIMYALVFGLALFMFYGRRKGFSFGRMFLMAGKGVGTVGNILITFFLIGVMTALWRAAGTIPVVVLYASGLIRPSVFLVMTFLLNCGLSFMTGTSFGTSATMGVICAAVGKTMGVSPVLTGGAVLSGAFFGDRCSPVSTSALLVATLTKTDIYNNIQRMLKTAFVPFFMTAAIYLIIGFEIPGEGSPPDLEALFSRTFRLSPVALLPAAVILLLAVLRVQVKLAMGVSILAAVPICLFVQGMSVPELLWTAVAGFYPADLKVAAMVSGGGVAAMIKVAGIVCLSSSYSEIFKETGLLDGLKKKVDEISRSTDSFTAVLVTSILSGMISCNQTLTIILTHQLCSDEYTDRRQFAVDIEDTAVVVSPLVPWSIAGNVPLAVVGAPTSALLTSFYLIILPLYRLAAARLGKREG